MCVDTPAYMMIFSSRVCSSTRRPRITKKPCPLCSSPDRRRNSACRFGSGNVSTVMWPSDNPKPAFSPVRIQHARGWDLRFPTFEVFYSSVYLVQLLSVEDICPVIRVCDTVAFPDKVAGQLRWKPFWKSGGQVPLFEAPSRSGLPLVAIRRI